jgi:DNA processing protein
MDTDTAVLQLMQARGLGAKTLTRILLQLTEERRRLEDLMEAPEAELTHLYGVRRDVAQGIRTKYDDAARMSDLLHAQGVSVLAIGSPIYPARLAETLKDTAPPVLFARGNVDILGDIAVGFCGSRHASEKGLKVAADCAKVLAESGANIVSGYAHGVDLTAHRTALESGGITTLVLAEGILHFRAKAEIADLLSESNYVVISEFAPRLGWIARNAMHRNRTICALSNAVIVIEAGATGGTFAAGKTALELRRPLFVVEYAKPEPSAEGNPILLKSGGQALRADREGKPNLARVFAVLDASNRVPLAYEDQMHTGEYEHAEVKTAPGTPVIEEVSAGDGLTVPRPDSETAQAISAPVQKSKRKGRARKARATQAQAILPLEHFDAASSYATARQQPRSASPWPSGPGHMVHPALFSVGNHHAPEAGGPPQIRDTSPDEYRGYFENAFGEQAIFVYDRITRGAKLYLGDAGWDNAFEVRDGYVVGLLLNEAEQLWLQACWKAATMERERAQ